MAEVKAWIQEHAFLLTQAVATGSAVFAIVTYMTTLENRVATLEIRGSPHLNVIDTRLTTLESQTRDNKERIERVVEIMTRELNRPK